DQNHEVPVNETFHEQTDDELTEKKLKQEIWLRVQKMMKGSDIRSREKKAKLFNEWERMESTCYHCSSKKDLHTTDYTQFFDFLKYNQKETDDELTEKELKQVEVDDQAIHTILLGLHEDIYAAVDSCENA
nr:hypothetical protein [Tanacetum cinerariifolium]